jgi:hypothetical protein
MSIYPLLSLDLHVTKVPSEAGADESRLQCPERKGTVLSAAANHNHATVLAGQSHHGKQKEPSNPMYTGQGEGTDLTKATSFLFFFWRLGEHAVLPSGVTAPRHGARQTAGGRT